RLVCNGTGTCSAGTCSVHSGDPCAGGSYPTRRSSDLADNCFNPVTTTCTDDGNPCTDDHCNGAGTCVHTDNTAPCDDGLFCNGTNTSRGGTTSVNSRDRSAAATECNNFCNEAADNCFN